MSSYYPPQSSASFSKNDDDDEEDYLTSAFAAATLNVPSSGLGAGPVHQEFRPGMGLVSIEQASAYHDTNDNVYENEISSSQQNEFMAAQSGLNISAREFTFSSATPAVVENSVPVPVMRAAPPGVIPTYRNGEQVHVTPEEALLYDEDETCYVNERFPTSKSHVSQENDIDGTAWWAKGTSTIPVIKIAGRSETDQSSGSFESMCTYFRSLAQETMQEMEPNDPRHKAVPMSYGSAFCLDKDANAGSFGYPSSVFKVVSREDGLLYCLRRLDNVKCVSAKITRQVNECWTKFNHPGVVKLKKCFIAQRALFFVNEYHPGAKTLMERYIVPQGNETSQILPERLIWSYITQLVATIRQIHLNRRACCCLQPNHILVTSGGRVRLSAIGVVDALEYEARKSLAELQREDMISLGWVILSLTTRTNITKNTDPDTMQRCMLFMSRQYSADLHMLTFSILTKSPSIASICSVISEHAFNELDSAHLMGDMYSNRLSVEFESGRALRLLLKLGFINERPEFGINQQWAETGDCYVLKLFRDYVFHQADEAGRPVIDIGHVVTSLNKLDCGDSEKIALVSRDGKALLVVSYAEIARCLDVAYNELCTSMSTINTAYGFPVKNS